MKVALWEVQRTVLIYNILRILFYTTMEFAEPKAITR